MMTRCNWSQYQCAWQLTRVLSELHIQSKGTEGILKTGALESNKGSSYTIWKGDAGQSASADQSGHRKTGDMATSNKC